MNIAFVCQSYPPMVSGAALVIQRLAEGLADLGHSVLVLSASDQGIAYSEDFVDLKLVRLRSFHNPVRVGQYFVIWSQDDIVQELTHFQPDILHTHDPLNIGVAALRASQKVNIPMILTIHQLPWFITTYLSIQPRVKNFLEGRIWQYSQWFIQQCEGLVTPSQMIAEIVETNTDFLPQVISNGVDLDLFSPLLNHQEAQELCKKYGLCPDHPVLLYVGRIDKDKRVDLVIRAAARVIQEIDVQLFIVGDGKQKDELIQLSHTLGIDKNCFFPGYISKHDDLPGVYRMASVFITASEIEVQSSVVLEAAASGLPVVTVRASSMPELVIDGENGYLVQPGDIDGMADRLVSLVKDPIRTKRMGHAAREKVERHSNERFIIEHEQLYKSVLREKGREREKFR
jgi:glycosyltransferase involved in cell wall biosynthesis